MEADAALTFFRAIKGAQRPGLEEIVIYDEETAKAYRIRVSVESVPAYLRQSYSARYGFATSAYVSWPRRILNRLRPAKGASA